VRRLHHVGVTVGDLERSLGFYRDLLGMPVLGVTGAEDVGAIIGVPGATARIADLDAGDGQILELLDYGTDPRQAPPRGPDAPGTWHASFVVADLQGVLARLESAGHPALGEQPVRLGGGGGGYEKVPEGAQIGHDPWEGWTVAYVRDPDGAIVELLERPPDA